MRQFLYGGLSMQSMSEATSTGYCVRFQKMKCGSSNPGMWFVADYKALLTTKRPHCVRDDTTRCLTPQWSGPLARMRSSRKLARVVLSAPVLVQGASAGIAACSTNAANS
jgi:hypothetical protein